MHPVRSVCIVARVAQEVEMHYFCILRAFIELDTTHAIL